MMDENKELEIVTAEPEIMTDEQAKAFIRKNPGLGRIRLAHLMRKSNGVTRRLIKEVSDEKRGGHGPVTGTPIDVSLSRAVDAESFRKQFDIPDKIRVALEKLKGKVIWDSDFRTELQVNATLWKRAAEATDLSKFQLLVRGRVLWGWPEDLDNIRKTMDVL